MSESIEVESSHCGMGHHPAVVYAVADRLAQAEGERSPFDRAGWPQPSLSGSAPVNPLLPPYPSRRKPRPSRERSAIKAPLLTKIGNGVGNTRYVLVVVA